MRTEKEAKGKVSGCTMKGQEAITEKKKEPEVTAEKKNPKMAEMWGSKQEKTEIPI